jgi:hypothetical protein
VVRNTRFVWEGRVEDKSDDSVWAVTGVLARALARAAVSRALARAGSGRAASAVT